MDARQWTRQPLLRAGGRARRLHRHAGAASGQQAGHHTDLCAALCARGGSARRGHSPGSAHGHNPANVQRVAAGADDRAADAMGHPWPADVDPVGYPRHWLDEEAGRLELWPTGPVYHAVLPRPWPAPPTDDPHGAADFAYDPGSATVTYTMTVVGADPTTFSQLEPRRHDDG
ncbi:MAG: hypothetical protein R2838_20775 [Caldilineaceae bacterium]